jgi:hypothetical protein
MENVFRNQLVSKNQFLRGKAYANSFPRNAYMSQYFTFLVWIYYIAWNGNGVDTQLGQLREEVVMAYFKVLSYTVHGTTENKNTIKPSLNSRPPNTR